MEQFKSSFIINGIFGSAIIPEISTYSDGSINVQFDKGCLPSNSDLLTLTAHIKDPIGLLALPAIVSVLRSYRPKALNLVLPFIPCGRQDRITSDDNAIKAFTLKHVVAEIINSCKFDRVEITDPHSDVSTALINNVVVKTQTNCILEYGSAFSRHDYIISPDAGATKKALESSKALRIPLIECSKVRDLISNKILKTNVNIDPQALIESTVVIFDDILDYGTTSRELAKVLKEEYGVKQVDLFVTHGILPINHRVNPPSRFTFPLETIDNIYCYYLWSGVNSEVNERIKSLISF